MLTRKRFVGAALAALAAACNRGAADAVKIGFIVKQPEEPWFQTEWRFAERAAAENNFELIKIGGTDGERVLAGIDNLGARGAQGMIICAPDTRLGAAIQQRAAANDLKLMSVDDRLLGADEQPIESIPHVGISATQIGRQVGETIAAEAARRGWSLARHWPAARDVRQSGNRAPAHRRRARGADRGGPASGARVRRADAHQRHRRRLQRRQPGADAARRDSPLGGRRHERRDRARRGAGDRRR